VATPLVLNSATRCPCRAGVTPVAATSTAVGITVGEEVGVCQLVGIAPGGNLELASRNRALAKAQVEFVKIGGISMATANFRGVLVSADISPACLAEPGTVAVVLFKLGPRFDNEFEPVFTEVAGRIGIVIDVQ